MAEPPAFFVPAATPETQEVVYAELATRAQRPVPKLSDRVYSIIYRCGEEEWTATVGETLQGVRRHRTHSWGRMKEHAQPLTDPATVLAIFPGVPYVVVTDHGLGGRSVGSTLGNPVFAGQPKSVVRFASL